MEQSLTTSNTTIITAKRERENDYDDYNDDALNRSNSQPSFTD